MGDIYYSERVLSIKMNNTLVNCPKCQKTFSNQQLWIQHSRRCQKEKLKNNINGREEKENVNMDISEKEEKAEVNMDSSEKEKPNSDGFTLEVKDPLGGGPMEIAISPLIEPKQNLEKTEKETTALLEGYNDFIKNNDAMIADLEKKAQEREKMMLEVSKNSSIEITDDDDDDCIPRLPSLPPGKRSSTDKAPPPQRILPKPKLRPMPPILPRQSLINRAGAGFKRMNPLECYYCGQASSNRIAVAKHVISDHWDEVRERQGGGRRDNSAYYNNIEDSRVIRPEPGSRVSKIYQKTSQVMNNVKTALATNNLYLNHHNPKWMGKLGANINKKARNVHSPSWYGTQPDRNLALKPNRPRPIASMPPPAGKSSLRKKFEALAELKKKKDFEASFDLTKDDPDACSVCDDDFNWPDEKHECKRNRQKPDSKKELNSSNRNKVLQPVSVSLNGRGSKTVPISVPIRTGGKDLRNLVKKVSKNSPALQIIPVMKK